VPWSIKAVGLGQAQENDKDKSGTLDLVDWEMDCKEDDSLIESSEESEEEGRLEWDEEDNGALDLWANLSDESSDEEESQAALGNVGENVLSVDQVCQPLSYFGPAIGPERVAEPEVDHLDDEVDEVAAKQDDAAVKEELWNLYLWEAIEVPKE
jgi:hypothetical protein